MLCILGIPLALVAAVFLYWQLRYPMHTYRYKLTVEVDTPEGVRSGYAVREVTWRDGPRITIEAASGYMNHRGEAVVVKLPENQLLFALLPPDGGETSALAFGTSRISNTETRSVIDLDTPASPGKAWGKDGFPRLVRFRDLADPSSVERIEPSDLSLVFGDGFKLSRITAQLTGDPVSQSVAKSLPWLSASKGVFVRKDPAVPLSDMPSEHRLSKFAFRRGFSDE